MIQLQYNQSFMLVNIKMFRSSFFLALVLENFFFTALILHKTDSDDRKKNLSFESRTTHFSRKELLESHAKIQIQDQPLFHGP